jgi:hypothetical protein
MRTCLLFFAGLAVSAGACAAPPQSCGARCLATTGGGQGGSGGGTGTGGGAAGGAAASDAGTWTPVTIDFDDLVDGDIVTTQYPEATFSTPSFDGNVVIENAGFCGTSEPNYSCTGSLTDCQADKTIRFTSPVRKLSFLAGCVDLDPGAGSVTVTYGGGLTASVDISAGASIDTPVRVDLSAFADVTQITIIDTDDRGFAVDDVKFEIRR